MSKPRATGTLLPTSLLAVYGFGSILVSGPVDHPPPSSTAHLPPYIAIAAVVAGAGEGFLLDRDGQVLRISGDGSFERTATVGPYSTPFGTAVGDQIVFGGIRCAGEGCQSQVAEVTILDRDGAVEASVAVVRTSSRPSPLQGLALVGTEGDTVWVNGAGKLFRVATSPAAVVDQVPWSGGEPCLIDGTLHGLSASAGTYGRQGTELPATVTFQLRVRYWDGTDWQPADDEPFPMAYGQNGYCTPTGYEVRAADTAVARWPSRNPGTGWEPVIGTVRAPPSRDPGTHGQAVTGTTGTAGAGREVPDLVTPVTSSTRRRYAVASDSSLLDVTGPGTARLTGVAVPGFTTSEMPPAIQVDDSGGTLFLCATTYLAAAATTRCSVARHPIDDPAAAEPLSRSAPEVPLLAVAGRSTSGNSENDAHHYNMCSAVCGNGVRPHSRDLIVWFVRQSRPVALSLNELCYDDGVHLAARLPAQLTTGTSYVALEAAVNCPGAVKQFGNQALVRSESERSSGSWAQFPTQAAAPCDHEVQECRGVACAESGHGDERIAFCSAHLESRRNGPSVAGIQIAEYVQLVRDRYGRRGHNALAGDLNLPHSEIDGRLRSDGFHSDRTGPTFDGHHPPASQRIDMIYVDSPAGTTGSSSTTHCDAQASDHCYLTTGWPVVTAEARSG